MSAKEKVLNFLMALFFMGGVMCALYLMALGIFHGGIQARLLAAGFLGSLAVSFLFCLMYYLIKERDRELAELKKTRFGKTKVV
jgi:hypothetical protein